MNISYVDRFTFFWWKIFDRTPNTQTPPTIALSYEILIDEYDYNEDLRNEENDIQVATRVAGGAQPKVNEQNEAINCMCRRDSIGKTYAF